MTQNQKSRRPTHNVYVVDGEGDKAFWTKIGSAWAHDDGDGFNVNLIALPLKGRLVLRVPNTETSHEEGAR